MQPGRAGRGAAREGSGLGVLPGRAQGHPGIPRALPMNTEHAPRASGEERQAGVPWFDRAQTRMEAELSVP